MFAEFKKCRTFASLLKPPNISCIIFQESFYHNQKLSDYQQIMKKVFFHATFTSPGPSNKHNKIKTVATLSLPLIIRYETNHYNRSISMSVYVAYCTRLTVKRKNRIRQRAGRICQCHFTDKRFYFHLRRHYRPTGTIQHEQLTKRKLSITDIRARLSNTTNQPE